MRYYKIRSEHLRASRTPKEGLVAVSFREAESRVTGELKDSHSTDKINSVLEKIKDNSITLNKDYSKKTVYAHNVPLVYRDIVREMFTEYNVLFEP